MKYKSGILEMIVLAVTLCVGLCSAADPPRESLRYQRDLTGEARAAWGLNAPVATFAGQIHQESAWRADARSQYASGLAQFTPDTAKWIAGAYPSELAGAQTLNPTWALRALVLYDQHLWSRLSAATSCDRMAKTLAAYNGGPGWITRDEQLTASAGKNPEMWFHHVELYSKRAGWAMKENREYPRKILLKHQQIYVRWGPGINCSHIA